MQEPRVEIIREGNRYWALLKNDRMVFAQERVPSHYMKPDLSDEQKAAYAESIERRLKKKLERLKANLSWQQKLEEMKRVIA